MLYCCCLNFNPNLWPWNPKTMSFPGYPKVISCTKFEHFGSIRFFNYAADIQTNKQMDPNTLPMPNSNTLVPTHTDFDLLNPKTISFLGYPNVIPHSKFEHFENIRFWVMLRTQRQANKQTDSNILPNTHADTLRWRGADYPQAKKIFAGSPKQLRGFYTNFCSLTL